MENKSKSISAKTLLTVVIMAALIGAVLYLADSNKLGVLTGSKETKKEDQKASNDKFQSVFLTNGQVYFGKLEDNGGNYVKLTDIYYLQAKDQAIQPKDEKAATQPDLVLIKLGKELHAPADEMNISRQQILFYEAIGDDGKVMQAIKDYKAGKTE